LLALFWRRKVSWPRWQGPVAAQTFRRQLGAGWCWFSGVTTVVLAILSVGLPLANLAWTKRTWMELPGAIAAGQEASWNSLIYAAASATVIVGLALITIHRPSIHKSVAAGPSLFGVLAWVPFFVPGILLGIALIALFNRPPFLDFYRSAGIVLLAFIVRYFALGSTGVRQALQSTDRDLSDVATLEGATRWQMLRHVYWPQIAPQVLATWYVVYLLCLWDVESMVLVVPPGGETLALRIFNLLHYGHATQVNALCVVLLALALGPGLLAVAYCGIRRGTQNLRRDQFARPLITAAAGIVVLVLSGCGGDVTKREAALRSSFFERAEIVGGRGVGVGEFNKTRSVAVDRQDNVYAVDMTGRVQKFSPQGEFLTSWQMPQTDLGKAKGMGCDREGNILVVEPHYQRVNHYAPDGTLMAQWGCRGTNAGCFILPRGIAQNSRGEFLVSEYMGSERVQRFVLEVQDAPPEKDSDSPGGLHPTPPVKAVTMRVLQVIGQAGTGPGEFNRPEGICVDQRDQIYVADSCNHRIQIFASDGTFVREFGKAGSRAGELSYPYDVAVDPTGNIFVCEFGNSRIQIFNGQGESVEIIGGSGGGPGQFNNPWGLALDGHGNLYVADALNHRLQKLVRREAISGPVVMPPGHAPRDPRKRS
jgi:ABC-type spermidine/putrescine transport system permease subunit II/DNA-binding beta-propeller fold protein YncE